MSKDLKASIEAKTSEILGRVCETRHFLHQNPELSMEEYKTAEFVFEKLKKLGLQPKMLVEGRGVTALIEGKGKGKTVALRADMDALPIEEDTHLPYASKKKGVMHACGHDGHTANLLGVAEVLLNLKSQFSGNVKLVFQPAEEGMGGARFMIKEGVLEQPHVDAIFAIHGWPGMGVGQVGIRSGPIMAASDGFTITITGKGTHAAYPEMGLSPIPGLSRLVQDLESIPSTRISSAESAVVSVTTYQAGSGSYNVIPMNGMIRGTFRTLSEKVRSKVREEIIARVKALESLGYKTDLNLEEGYPVTYNASQLQPIVEKAVDLQLGEKKLETVDHSSMGSEDFAYYGAKVPSYYMRLGVGDRPMLHHPKYDFNDESFPAAIGLMSRIAIEYLTNG